MRIGEKKIIQHGVSWECKGSISHFYVKQVFLVQMVQKVTEFELFRIKPKILYLQSTILELLETFWGFYSEKQTTNKKTILFFIYWESIF